MDPPRASRASLESQRSDRLVFSSQPRIHPNSSLGNLERRQSHLSTRRRRVQSQIDALVEGIADRIMPIKSVGAKIVELEELDDEVLEVDLEIEATKAKAVSAQSLTETLTTLEDLYREAIPEERRQLVRLRVNQLVWKSDEIRLALLDHPCQMFDESAHLVARTLHSLNPRWYGTNSLFFKDIGSMRPTSESAKKGGKLAA